MARPTSSGSPVRFMGTELAICARISAVEAPVLLALFETICSNRAVFVAPGSTLLTVIPCTPTSLAQVLAQLATAPLIVLLTPRLFSGCLTLVLMTLMMRPYPAAFMPGSTAWASR